LRLDESLGTTGSTQDEGGAANNDETAAGAAAGAIGYATLAAAALFTEVADAGTDGQASKVYSLVLNSSVSGLTDAVTDQAIVLVLTAGGVVEGRVGNAAGPLSFTIEVAADGSVTVNQFRSIEHNDDDDHDENTSPATLEAGIVELEVELTDGD